MSTGLATPGRIRCILKNDESVSFFSVSFVILSSGDASIGSLWSTSGSLVLHVLSEFSTVCVCVCGKWF